MTGEFAISCYLAVGITGALAVGSFFPPLTTSGDFATPTTRHQILASQQLSYCQSNLSDVNCVCFAGKAGHIMAHDGPKIPGLIYKNQSVLARDQAMQSC